MAFERVVVGVMLVGLVASNVAAGETSGAKAAVGEQPTPPHELAISLPVGSTVSEPAAKRPATLPALYAALAGTEGWDLYSTSRALKAGAHEANLQIAPVSRNVGAMIGLKAATSAAVILCSEKMWKKNGRGAVVLMTLVNGAMAGVAVHNLHNARTLAPR